jgi:ferredoxin
MNSEFANRMPDNVPGKFYVTSQCLDCDLCRETAPNNFTRLDAGGYSYIYKQPENPEEETLCREALEGCCTAAIFEDGDQHDWKRIPPYQSSWVTPVKTEMTCCNHKPKKKPWWRLW